MNTQVDPIETSPATTLDASKVALIRRFLGLMVWLDGRTMADVLMPFQIGILNSFLATIRPDGYPQFKRGLIHVAKKNAKTLLLILAAMFTLHTDKPLGRKGCQIIYVANDEGQADENLDFTKKLYRCNPILTDAVTVKSNVIELKNGEGYIEIVASGNTDGLHGRSYRLLCFDELHAQTDYRVLESLELDPTRPDAQQLFASYSPLVPRPGIPITDILAQHTAGLDTRLYVFSRSGSIEQANPAMGGPLGSTRESIESARLRLPSWHYRRLFENLPGQAQGAAFDGNAVEACIVRGRKVLPRDPRYSYVAFFDSSGGTHDDSVGAIAHLDEHGHVVLDLLMDQGVRSAGGMFDPDTAVQRFVDAMKVYGCHEVTGDRYSAEWVAQAFRKRGIAYRVSEMNRSELYANLEPLLNTGTAALLEIPKLIEQLLGLIRKGAKINHAPGNFDDHANAAAGAIVMAKQPQITPGCFVFMSPSERMQQEGFQRIA